MKFSRLWFPLLVLSATAAADGAFAAEPQVDIKTNLGTFRVELFASRVPKTVENFLQYVKDGHYNGTIFHRVIDNFMIQGGGFDSNFAQKPTRAPIQNEAEKGIRAGLKNDIGTLAMARTSNPNSATAQFFVNTQNNDFLNNGDTRGDGYGYAVFGKVISGMDVINTIGKVRTASGGPFNKDVPKDAVVIESVTLIEAKK